jgi:formiminotetrahydrofolate cyclodeaminase
LASSTIKEFLRNLSSDSPAPGGGSVAALCGALSASLSSMVCELTIGKEKYIQHQNEIKQVLADTMEKRTELTRLIDEDTHAFNDVMKAFKMPKETEDQKKKRSKAIQEGYKKAAQVPLKTARLCQETLDLAQTVAEKGNVNSITDAGVAAKMGEAGVYAALLNVKINLESINDVPFKNETLMMIRELEEQTEKKTKTILSIVEGHLS